MGDIKIGNSSITLKLGSADVSAAYIGSTLVYSGGTPPTPSLQWVTLNVSDSLTRVNIYGIKGIADDLAYTAFSNADILFTPDKTHVDCSIENCFSYQYSLSDNVELIFSDLGCSDYYTSDVTNYGSSSIQLLIYQ